MLSAPAACVPATDDLDGACPAGAPAQPAKRAGLQQGDRVVAVDGAPVTTFDGFVEAIRCTGPARSRDLIVDGTASS